MATTEDVKSKWYQALFEEDCLVVMKLLNDHPSLLMIGRKSEPSRQVKGRRRREGMGRTQSTWKGRTALHVGASRGCLQLIIQVLGLCLDDFCKIHELHPVGLISFEQFWFEQFSMINELYQERLSLVEKLSFSKIQVHPSVRCHFCGVCPILGNRWKSTVKTNYDLCQNCYEQNGNEEEFVKIETGLPHGPVGMDTISFTKRTARDTIKETPGKSADSTDDVRNSLHGPMVEMAAGQPQRAKNKAADNNKKTEKASDNRGQNVRDLLLAKDGEYGLNALAIAALNGNQELMALLCFGMIAVRSVDPRQPADAGLDRWSSKVLAYFPLANLTKRKLLRRAMVKLALEGCVDRSMLEEYYEHRDFNFLPPEEYLFHFLLANPQESRTFVLRTRNAIISFKNELLRLLLQLHDGQGRPPFHVAIEESQKEYLSELLETWSTTGMDREKIICALTTTDRLGRTPVHRAAAKGLPDALRVIFKYAKTEKQVVATYNASWRADEVDTVASWEWAMDFSDIWGLPEDDGFPLQFPLLQTPLHAAIIHGNFDCAKLLLDERSKDWGSMPYLSLWGLEYWPKEEAKAMDIMHIINNERKMPTRLQVPPLESPRQAWIWIEWDVVELACLVGAPAEFVGFLMELLKVDLREPRQSSSRPVDPIVEGETHEVDLREPRQSSSRPVDPIVEGETHEVDLREPRQSSSRPVDPIVEGETHEEFDEGEQVEEFDGREKDRKEWRKRFQSSKVAECRKWRRPSHGDRVLTNLWHPLHLAAALGKYDVVKYFVNDIKLKPFFEDFEGNSVLHHALDGSKVRDLELTTHFLDYVDSEHIHLSQQNNRRIAKKQILDDNPVAERQGCINVLLQAGCEVFKTNNRKQLPYPAGKLNDAKFLSWWYSKQQEEFKTTQNDLNFATNAIAVTATLVATASYVGPLQPPMGYDANQIQYENVWVSIFIVCDTLSFYFAIFAITLSLIPSLSLPQQAMLDELQRTRGMVILAVGILLPSIIFVFLAFAASSISVMSANITSETGGTLTIVSTIIGVVLCLLGFTLFGIRFLAFVYPKYHCIRKLYELSNYITKFSEQ